LPVVVVPWFAVAAGRVICWQGHRVGKHRITGRALTSGRLGERIRPSLLHHVVGLPHQVIEVVLGALAK
jgi:hypothetical protein